MLQKDIFEYPAAIVGTTKENPGLVEPNGASSILRSEALTRHYRKIKSDVDYFCYPDTKFGIVILR